MERLLNYEQKFLSIHTMLVLSILIYAVFICIVRDPKDVNWALVILAIVTHLMNYILHRLRFINKPLIFYALKLVQVTATAFTAFVFKPYIGAIGALLLILLFIEILVVACHHSKWYQNVLTFICVLDILVVAIFVSQIFTTETMIESVFYIAVFVFLLIGLSFIIVENFTELQKQVETQRNLFTKAKKTNEQLRITQEKYKNAHDQLAKQNLDLEEAYTKLNRASSETYIQNELLRYISSALEIDALMDMVTDSIIGAIGVDTCSIIIYDESKKNYQIKIKSIYSKDYTQQVKNSLEQGQLDAYFNCSRIYTDNQVNHQVYPFLEDRHVGSLMITPLTHKTTTYGLLIAEHKAPNTFKDNIQFFDGIATQINIAINNANLYARMEEMAIRDGLTGVYNRAYLQRRFSEIMRESVEHNAHLSVLLFDIDKFKKVNDTYGHLFGDEAIKMVANMSEKLATIHKGLVGRYGGEEFVIILPNQSIDKANNVAEEILAAIKSEPLYYNNEEKIHINVSIGVTSYPEICSNPNELINRADAAMYYSKQHGRGRITLDSPTLDTKYNL